jgi:hypothetical protein
MMRDECKEGEGRKGKDEEGKRFSIADWDKREERFFASLRMALISSSWFFICVIRSIRVPKKLLFFALFAPLRFKYLLSFLIQNPK